MLDSINIGSGFNFGGGTTVADLRARIADLEDCLQELAPFAECMQVDMQAHFSAASKDEAEFKGWAFKRDTLYLDQRVFRRIKKLLKAKV